MKLKTGQKRVITKNKYGHGFKKKEEVEILKINSDGGIDCKSLKTGKRFWCREDELK